MSILSVQVPVVAVSRHQFSVCEDTESFVQFRRELRDFLRELGAEKGQQAAHAGRHLWANFLQNELNELFKSVDFFV